jgi:hypothetical protein
MRSTILVLMLAVANAAADTEIHRCLLDDGTIAFQEKPCSERAVDADGDSESERNHGTGEDATADDDAFDFVNPFDQPARPPAATETTGPGPVSRERADCEKVTRDAIDAIDREMRETAYTKEQGQAYLEKLLTLTQQLRHCKGLGP